MKKLCILLTTFLILQNTTFATSTEITADEQEIQTSIEVFELDKFNDMLQILEAQDYSVSDYNEVVYNYVYIAENYNLSNDELNYIADLIIDGCNARQILEIVYFWLDTNENITIVKTIYDMLPEFEFKSHKIENAFNKITNNKCGVLDVDDIYNYLSQGITMEEINIANKLSRKGVYTIQQLLDERIKGTEITKIYSELIDNSSEHIRFSVSTNKALMSLESKNALNNNSLLNEDEEDYINAQIKERNLYKKEIKLNKLNLYLLNRIYGYGYTESQINNLIQQNFSLTDILNLASVTTVVQEKEEQESYTNYIEE